MSLVQDIKTFQEKYGRTKKSLGQHFLKDENIARRIVSGLNPKIKNIIEIGPGIGALTKFILEDFPQGKITLFEVDKRSLEFLKEQDYTKGMTLINQNILKAKFESKTPWQVISNLPYNISSQILLKFFYNTENIPDTMVCMIQRELAQRIIMKKEKANVLGLALQHILEVEKFIDVSRNCFIPPPEVQSMVIKLVKKPNTPDLSKRKDFINLLQAFFQNRRKKMSTIIKQKKLNIKFPENFNDLRPEDLSLKDWELLAKEL